MTAVKRVPRTWWLVGMTAWVLAVVAIAIGLATWARFEGPNAVRATLQEATPWLLLWRLTVWSMLMLGWGPLSAAVARHLVLSTSSEQALRAWRWRAGAGLVLIDLVLVEDLVGAVSRVI
jgi:hypothetical protein